MRRWSIRLAACAIAFVTAAGTAQAQNWPTKPIRMIVPYPAGGLSDVFARLVGDKLGQILGQSIVIDNRPGGNTIIGTQATAQAAPDGYVLLLTNGALSINQSLVANLPYNLDKGLAPVIWLGESYGLIVVNDKVPARTFPELIALARAQPGKITVAVPGLGSGAHALLASMIHQSKRIVLRDLRELEDGTFAAAVTVNGANVASDPILLKLREKHGAAQ